MYTPEQFDQLEGTEIAIIGMNCRFPGAPDLESFWRLLTDGREAITQFAQDELAESERQSRLSDLPNYVKAAPVLDQIDLFDATFFGYTPREAELMDPQHRLMLETAWHTLEHAGYATNDGGRVGVFAGARTNTYLLGLASRRDLVESIGAFEIGLGNDLAFLPTRISHKLNLTGPSYAVHTACSTGLVAAHLASQSLLVGECDLALAGSVALNIPQAAGYLHTPDGILSPDGHCRPFDNQAAGTLFGSGVGMVALKRLEDAMRDDDTIYAVIRGSATNNDGSRKASFTAPAVQGQTNVILDALTMANVDADSLGYVEAHGTGTALGDPIELRALSQAFQQSTERRQFCGIGSLKSNMGHLDAAAGVAGLIKTALMLKHGTLPPTLHFQEPNPELRLTESPFFVVNEVRDWPNHAGPRRAAVSSFGVGGTNAHLVLEQAPQRQTHTSPDMPCLLPISAKSEAGRDALTMALRESQPDHWASVAQTLQFGRGQFTFRAVIPTLNGRQLDMDLKVQDRVDLDDRPVAFVFPGNGSQHAGMARGLYAQFDAFRETIDACRNAVQAQGGGDIHAMLDATSTVDDPATSMAALFSVDLAMAKLWQTMGLTPAFTLGHSLGEYVAAHLAGVFDLNAAVKMVLLRGQLIGELAAGAMLACDLDEATTTALLNDPHLSIAACNGPKATVVSGAAAAVDAFAERLQNQGHLCRKLVVDAAFHSPMVDPLLERFHDGIAQVSFQAPQTRYISCASGTWAGDEVAHADFWVRHLREPVRFNAALDTANGAGPHTFIEVGPGQALTQLGRSHLGASGQRFIASAPRSNSEANGLATFLQAVGRVWCAGTPIDWQALQFGQTIHRVPAPLYPYQRQRYWIDPAPLGSEQESTMTLGKRSRVDDWCYQSAWRVYEPDTTVDWSVQRTWLVCHRDVDGDPAQDLIHYLRQQGQQVVEALPGDGFQAIGDGRYSLDPKRPDNYSELLEALVEQERAPHVVVHSWLWCDAPNTAFDEDQLLGYYSALYLARAMDFALPDQGVNIQFITRFTADVRGDETCLPSRATLTGPLRVLPQEMERVATGLIDIEPPAGARHRTRMASQLAADCLREQTAVDLAYRGTTRWQRRWHKQALDESAHSGLRQGGVYLITGGLGGVGAIVGRDMAQHEAVKLVITGRSELPPRDQWDSILAEDHTSRVAQAIVRIRSLEDAGATVHYARADVADADAMAAVVQTAEQQFGALHGVLHAAGITSGDSLYTSANNIGLNESAAQFAPKIRGVLVLDDLLKDRDLDFVMLFSSSAAVLGGLGYAAYSAANAYMDAFATMRTRTSATPWYSVSWDPWPLDTKHDDVQTSLDDYAMTPGQANQVIRRLLAHQHDGHRLIVTGDMAARYDFWITQMATTAPPKREGYRRGEQENAYVAPETETQITLAELWQEVLGIDRVGITDSFFDLGGHSLLATRLLGRITHRYQIKLSLASFFETPSVAALAERIDQLRAESEDQDKQEILDLLAELSDEEVAAQLEE